MKDFACRLTIDFVVGNARFTKACCHLNGIRFHVMLKQSKLTIYFVASYGILVGDVIDEFSRKYVPTS